MATFSTNQVMQLYVAKAVDSTYIDGTSTWNPATTTAGTIDLKANSDGKFLYFNYIGAGGITRSDIIDIDNILSVKATTADEMAYTLKQKIVTLSSDVNGGAPVAGQDYIMLINIRQAFGMSDEDTYQKYGMVHAYSGMTASTFYAKLAISLAKNFSRDLTKFFTFALQTSTGTTEVDAYTKESELTDTYTGVIITEVAQEWTLGIKEQVPVYFDVFPRTISLEGDEVIWGTVEDSDSGSTINNGHKIADLEYFCMGERGDQYRNINWPNSIPTTYLVDPTLPYYTLDIHYAYTGPNEGPQKSEKDIMIVASDQAVLTTIITALNTATGLSVAFKS